MIGDTETAVEVRTGLGVEVAVGAGVGAGVLGGEANLEIVASDDTSPVVGIDDVTRKDGNTTAMMTTKAPKSDGRSTKAVPRRSAERRPRMTNRQIPWKT